MRTLLFGVKFFHFFCLVVDFTTEAFGFEDFRMRSETHNPAFYLA